MSQRPIIIDCNNIAHMARHSMGDLSFREMQTGVVFGFMLQLLSIARKFESARFIMCWDSKRSFREMKYPAYKSKRKTARNEMTDDDRARYFSFVEQVQELRTQILPRLGFKNNFIRTGYESDDIMAHIVNTNRKNFLMVSADNDMLQCLDRCDIYNPQTKKAINQSLFRKKFGILPSQWARAKAIGGCASDNVEGIVGAADPKSPTSKALKFVRGELTSGVIHDRIVSKEGQAIINRNIDLVQLPMSGNMRPCVLYKNKFKKVEFRLLFDEKHFQSFIREFQKWEIFWGN